MVLEEEALLLTIIIAAGCLLLPKKRRWWVKPWIQERENNKGSISLVHNELCSDDPESFKNFIRMDETVFNNLLKIVCQDIEKTDTVLRESISARDRLTVTLRFLATGESYKSLSYSFRMGHSTISEFIPQVCRAIYENLKADYLKVPSSTAEWLNIAEDFNKKWNCPNVLGALDGKHIAMTAPRKQGSAFFNYKGHHSIVLLALVDANYKFIYVDVGTNGKISDGGVFRQSTLATAIDRNLLKFPESRPLPGRTTPVPFVILGDAAFPLSEHILKPFPFRNMSMAQRIFNYRLSRGRRIVENSFGMLANRFRVLLSTINLEPPKVQTITLACVALHNYLRTTYPETYNDENIDRRFTFANRLNLSKQSGNRSSASSLQNRNEFLEYFNGVGAVPWQNDLA